MYCSSCIDGGLSNGSISVLNACRLKTPDGQLNTIRGYAFRPDDKEQGKLQVVFGRKPIGGTNCKEVTSVYSYLNNKFSQIGLSSWDHQHSMEPTTSIPW